MPQEVVTSAVVAAAVLAGLVLARALRRTGFSTMIAISVVGVALGSLLPKRLEPSFGPGVLAIFLPALIFEAAWDADAAALRRAAGAIVMLAVPGVLLTCATVAAAALFTRSVAIPEALVLGAIVAATDPVSVLATFRRLGLPHLLVTIVEGESVANDGVALVLVQTFVPLAVDSRLHLDVPVAIVAAVTVSGGGAIAGALVALSIGLAMRARIGAGARIALTVAVAYGSYALASWLGLSGIFAAAAGGIVLRSLARTPLDGTEALTIDRAWDAIAFVMNAIVFALVGLSLQPTQLVHEPVLLLSVLAAVVVSRLVLAYALVPLRTLTRAARAWRHAIALAGMRGGLSLALAVGLPATMPAAGLVRDATFAVVFTTLIVQGSLIAPLLRRLRLAQPTGAA